MRNRKLYMLTTAVFTIVLAFILLYVSRVTDKAKFLNGRYLTDTIEISSEKEFLDFVDSVNNGNQYNGVRVVLTKDLDFSDFENIPQIGVPGTNNYFCGLFDGQGHEIHNITVSNLAVPYVRDALLPQDLHDYHGLFLDVPGVICNLVIRDGVMPCDKCEKNLGLYIANTRNASAGLYNCLMLSEYEFYDLPYTGDTINCLTSDDISDNYINGFLKDCSAKADGVLMNSWKEADGTIKMDLDNRIGVLDISLDITSKELRGELYAWYKEGTYNLFIPSSKLRGSATLNISNSIGQHYSESFELTGEDSEMHIEALKEEINLNVYYAKKTEAVIVNTEYERGINYIKSDILHMPKGNIRILDNEGNTNVFGNLDYMRGRGNNSWTKTDKKGYKIKLDKEFDVLNMGVASEFFLISGSRDASLFTYKVCEDLWKDMDFDFCRDNRIVNLFVDGEYQGAYLLVEAIEVRPGRIEINDLADDTGDYLYEIDNRYYRENPFNFSTGLNTYIIDNAHEPTKKNLEYSANFMKEYESAVLNEDSVAESGRRLDEICDIESVSKQLLAYEMLSEWSTEQSVFWVKYSDYSGDGKLHALAPWDIEHSLLHTELDSLSLLEYDRSGGLYQSLMKKKEVLSEMKKIYNGVLRKAMVKMISSEDEHFDEQTENFSVQSLDYYCREYEQESEWNAMIWGDHKKFDSKAEDVREFLTKKMDILDKFFETVE